MMHRKNLLFIVLDGIGDRLVKELENRTPLEAAYTPILDKLAGEGVTGLVQVLPFAPESDEAIFTLLGYDLKDYRARGPLEAIGSNIDFSKGMLALRREMKINFHLCETQNCSILNWERRFFKTKKTKPFKKKRGQLEWDEASKKLVVKEL